MPTAERMPSISGIFIPSYLANNRHPIDADFLSPVFHVDMHAYDWHDWRFSAYSAPPTGGKRRPVWPLGPKGSLQNKKFAFDLFSPNLNSGGQGCGQILRQGAPSSVGPHLPSFAFDLWKEGMSSGWEVVGRQCLTLGSFLLAPPRLPHQIQCCLPTLGLRRDAGRRGCSLTSGRDGGVQALHPPEVRGSQSP